MHKRRDILSSPKELKLISLITPFVLKRMTKYGSVRFNSLLNLSITNLNSKKKQIGTKARKRGVCTERF